MAALTVFVTGFFFGLGLLSAVGFVLAVAAAWQWIERWRP